MFLSDSPIIISLPHGAIKGSKPRTGCAVLCTQIKRDYLIEVIPLIVMDDLGSQRHLG
jgi:hypothetical protein